MNKGYTLIELLVSMGILAILFAITTINISPLPSNTLQTTNLDTLLSDIRSQQTQAMTNDASYGVHFEPGSYTLFTGESYTQGLSANTVISLDSGIVFSNVTFPNSVIVFSPGTGDIVGYTAGADSFVIKSSVTNKSTTVRINKHGATY
ncbi:MAG: type II secretion system protein [Candidatus Woesebacteria bacterium]|nr:type II secretion system protein [Candidatus Woesebacteria bacterium]